MPDTAKPYVLIVDDTAANLRVLGSLLRGEGWTVAAATSGDQALQLVARRVPDLALLDVMMPEMDGFELCQRLRTAPATRDLPILFITALTDEESIVRGFKEGAQDYIAKPFRQAELIARVRTHLALREATLRAERQAADLTRLNADKDRFYSIIAHDLRSPLAGLLGLSEALAANLAEFSPADVAESTTEMAKAARNLYQLLENLLEWSQLQTGRMECRPERVKLHTLLTDLGELFSQSAQQKEVTLRLDLQPVEAWGDRRMIHAVFRNLVSNALKFTRTGGEVSLRSELRDGSVVGEISDTGEGITPEQLDKLFTLGTKPVSKTGTAGERGTGLGLILCRELVERAGGAIAARSTLGEGSAFSVTLPLPPTRAR
ncbi:MAG TPA: hybrid sensor histidine kinase/response regulator [Opitutales bacterium]|jgi:two-component system sensor histidine kinase/response regulator|nr:hybrid sensor histidine kinase/response regulator [Opitutales bacterium]